MLLQMDKASLKATCFNYQPSDKTVVKWPTYARVSETASGSTPHPDTGQYLGQGCIQSTDR